MRQSPFSAQLEALGAIWRVAGSTAVAANFGDVRSEVAQAHSGAVMSDGCHRGRLRVTGADRTSFLQGQSTGNVATLALQRGRMTAFLNGKGKLRGLANVVRSADALDLLCDPAATMAIRDHLRSFIIMEDVGLGDRGDQTVQIDVHGPAAGATLELLLGAKIAVDVVEFRSARTMPTPGVEVVATRTNGVLRFAVIADATAGREIWSTLVTELPVIGEDAVEVLRVESGQPAFGVDLDGDTIPIEAGLVDLIDYDKGCFTGYEVVARIRTYGHVNRRLVGLLHDGETPSPNGTTVAHGDKVVGRVSSSVYSSRVGAAISLAMVRREVSEPGTELVAGDARLVVVATPFVGRASGEA